MTPVSPTNTERADVSVTKSPKVTLVEAATTQPSTTRYNGSSFSPKIALPDEVTPAPART